LQQNDFAEEKIIVPGYDQIGEFLKAGENDFVVIMTVGYRTDKIVLKQLVKNDFFYLGLLGSQTKVDTVFTELKAEGVREAQLKKVCAPIGIDISSKTSKEIAVSIAAEITRKKNSGK
jgi:xanthine dehydrogenase accessory factor